MYKRYNFLYFFFFLRIFVELISNNMVLIAQGGRDTVIQSVRRIEGKRCLKISIILQDN